MASWGAKVDIEVAPPDIDSVFRANTQVWVDDGVRTDIKRKGHGLQRALMIALIQVIAKRAAEEEGQGEGVRRQPSRSRYFILEEPELYLHPQAQRSLFDSFVWLSESGSQVILCTHSSALIDVERYRSIYIATKQSEASGTKVRQCSSELFTGDKKKDFNLSYWINPDRGELFFATKVILVEGPTDKTVIPLLGKKLEGFRYDYTVVDCGSKTNIPLYIRILNAFSIPYVAVYDKDHHAEKEAKAIESAEEATRLIEEEVSEEYGVTVFFDNDIEEELGMVGGGKCKPAAALDHISKEGYEISAQLEGKIKTIFDIGN